MELEELKADFKTACTLRCTNTLTAKCGHRLSKKLDSSLGPKLSDALEDFQTVMTGLQKELKQVLHPEPLQQTSQIIRKQYSLLKGELNAAREENTNFNFSDLSFETVKSKLTIELKSHEEILMRKQDKFIKLEERNSDLERMIIQEEDLIRMAVEEVPELKRLKEQKIKMHSLFKERAKKLIWLIETHFPILPPNQLRQLAGIHKYRIPDDLSTILPFRELLVELITRVIDSPKAPEWYKVDSTVWMPYVNLLSVCGIIRFHPNNGNQIAMYNFGE